MKWLVQVVYKNGETAQFVAGDSVELESMMAGVFAYVENLCFVTAALIPGEANDDPNWPGETGV